MPETTIRTSSAHDDVGILAGEAGRVLVTGHRYRKVSTGGDRVVLRETRFNRGRKDVPDPRLVVPHMRNPGPNGLCGKPSDVTRHEPKALRPVLNVEQLALTELFNCSEAREQFDVLGSGFRGLGMCGDSGSLSRTLPSAGSPVAIGALLA